jgi:hypothetical protein
LARDHDLPGGAHCLSGAARVADFREVNRQEVDDTAEQREREEQDELVEALARSNGVHREVDGCKYVQSDSNVGHVGCLVLVRPGTIVGVGWGANGAGDNRAGCVTSIGLNPVGRSAACHYVAVLP